MDNFCGRFANKIDKAEVEILKQNEIERKARGKSAGSVLVPKCKIGKVKFKEAKHEEKGEG